MPEVEIELPRHRVGVVAVGLFDDEQIAELRAVAKERQLVLASPSPRESRLDLAGIGEPEPRLAEKIQTDVGERDVLFEHRAVTDPLAEPLREHEIAVREP